MDNNERVNFGYIWAHESPGKLNITMSWQSHSHPGNTNRNRQQEHFRSRIEHSFWSIAACQTNCRCNITTQRITWQAEGWQFMWKYDRLLAVGQLLQCGVRRTWEVGSGGGESKPDIHFNPLWRRSFPGTICLFCLCLLSHPASLAERRWTSSAQAEPPPTLERFISAKLCLPSTFCPLPDLWPFTTTGAQMERYSLFQ